jgi:hypothetical protein
LVKEDDNYQSYFDSIDQIISFQLNQKENKSKKPYGLLVQIINSFNTRNKNRYPIGNLTSQLFANILFNELDQFVKLNLKQKRFIRYWYDFLILGKEKRKMHFLKEKIRGFLKNNLKLKLNPKKS